MNGSTWHVPWKEESSLEPELLANPVSFYALSDQISILDAAFGTSIRATLSEGQPRQVLFLEMGKQGSASPKISLQLSLTVEGRSHAAPGNTHFLNSFCTVNSWWLLFTVQRLPELIYFRSVFAPSYGLGGRAWSSLIHACKVQLNYVFEISPQWVNQKLNVRLNFPLRFNPGLQVKATPFLCLHTGFSWTYSEKKQEEVALNHTWHYKIKGFSIKVTLPMEEVWKLFPYPLTVTKLCDLFRNKKVSNLGRLEAYFKRKRHAPLLSHMLEMLNPAKTGTNQACLKKTNHLPEVTWRHF